MITKIIVTTTAMVGISGFLSLLLVIAERYLANYGECRININNEKELNVKGGATLLASLGSQKIFLPSACGGRGTCAYCKCKVIEGAGPLLPTEEPLLTEEEINNKIRLSCQVKVKQNIKIEIPEALFNIKEYNAEVSLIKDLTYDIKLLRLNLIEPKEISFKAGQYVQLHSNPYNSVKESVSRAYSISSPNHQKIYIELMIRQVPEGICTTWVHQFLKENDVVKFVGPMGDFFLRDGKAEIILIAGGSGMAPMVSLLEEMAQKEIKRKVTYFFGAVNKKDLFYTDEMAKFKENIADFTFIPILSESQPEDEWHGETGLITVPLEKYLENRNTAEIQGYLCGSPGMINACISILNKHGIPDDRIFFDPFA